MSQGAAVPFFVAGGTVPPGSPSYVERSADRELFQALVRGEFGYVLNSRQMGKSSLAVRTIGRLNEVGIRTAFIDLTRLGATGADPERWYAGLLIELGRALGMRSEAMAYLKANESLPPAGRLFGFLADEVTARADAPLVVFIDEVDATRTLPFSADDLFAGLREAWNARAQNPAYERLTFCLMGAALPSDLIRDPRITPFNVGCRIELRDFTPEEAQALSPGLGPNGEALVKKVMAWTGGHPYLTQALCADLLASPGEEGRGASLARVDALVQARYLDARARESDTNLVDVANRLLGTGDPNLTAEDRTATLLLFGRMLRGERVADDETNSAAARIKMSGVARVDRDGLTIRNRIYERAFGRDWVDGNLPGGELRLQQKAFRQGAIRTGLVAAAVLAVVGGLAVSAVGNANRAEANARQAQINADEAKVQAGQANRGMENYRKQKELAERRQRQVGELLVKASKAAEKLEKALAAQKALSLRADASAKEARASAVSAREGRDLVARGNVRLAKELYAANVSEVSKAWTDIHFDRVEELVRATQGPNSNWEWGFWHRLAAARLFRDSEHPNVSVVDTPPPGGATDGRHVLQFSAKQTRVVDIAAGRSRAILPAYGSLPPAAQRMPTYAYSANGRWFVHPSLKGGLIREDLATGARHEFASEKGFAFGAALSDDGTRLLQWPAPEGTSTTFALRSTVDGRVIAEGKVKPTYLLTLSPDGKRLLFAESGDDAKMDSVTELEIASGQEFDYPCAYARSMGYVGSGGSVWTLDSEGKLRIYPRGKAKHSAETDFADAQSATVSADGKRSVLAGTGGALLVSLGRSERHVSYRMPFVNGLLSSDGRRIVATDMPFSVFDTARLAPFTAEEWSHAGLEGPLMGSDGSRLQIEVAEPVRRPSPNGLPDLFFPVVQVTSVAPDGRPIARFPAVRSKAIAERVFSDGNTLATPVKRGTEIRRLPDFRPIRSVDCNPRSGPATTADGRRTIYIDRAGRLAMAQRRPDGKDERAVLSRPRYTGYRDSGTLWISPNGHWAVVTGTEGTSPGDPYHYDVWDLEARRLRSSLPNYRTDAPMWTPDGKAFLTCGRGLEIHDLAAGSVRRIAVLPGGDNNIRGALSPDGSRLAIRTGADLWLFDATTGRELLRFGALLGPGAKQEEYGTVAFTPDGRSLIDVGNQSLRTYRSDHP